MARKKGTKTMELVGPIWSGGGRHDLRVRGEAARVGGLALARKGKSAADHWTTKGPDSDGMVTSWPSGGESVWKDPRKVGEDLGVRLGGRAWNVEGPT